MERLLRVLQLRRLDSTKMTTHTFSFEDVDKDFEIIDGKLDGVMKPLIVF